MIYDLIFRRNYIYPLFPFLQHTFILQRSGRIQTKIGSFMRWNCGPTKSSSRAPKGLPMPVCISEKGVQGVHSTDTQPKIAQTARSTRSADIRSADVTDIFLRPAQHCTRNAKLAVFEDTPPDTMPGKNWRLFTHIL